MTTANEGVKDLYPSETKAVQGIMAILMARHSFKGVRSIDQEDAIKRVFEAEAKSRCADLGFVVGVEWEPNVSDDPNDQNLYWNPKLIVTDRLDKLQERDHDRIQHEVRAGLVDGKVGVIDPNSGELKESPKKKMIF